MTDTRLRRTLGGTLTAFLLLGGLGATDAVAGPKDKTPDQTPNDHPSGKDRTGSSGGSGAQGKSQSDPDGMSNGGADKPGGDGGFDDDQDGNNGCGNDDDFEDDNNGNCGGLKKGHAKAKVAGVKVSMPRTCGHAGCADVDATDSTSCDVCADKVAAVAARRHLTVVDTVAPTTVVSSRAGDAEVLGVSFSRGTVSAVRAGAVNAAAGALPRTGSTTAALALGGIVLVTAGSVTVATARPRR
jgi:hypothetical protein